MRSIVGTIVNRDWCMVDHGEMRLSSLLFLKDYGIMKKVIWNNAVCKNPETGEEVEKEQRCLDLSNLTHQVRELVMLLEMRNSGLLCELSEKRILKRFEQINTV